MIFRIRGSRQEFTTISRQLLRTTELSFEEKGLLVTLLSYPDNFEISRAYILENFDSKKHKIDKILKSLMTKGYIKTSKHQPKKDTKYQKKILDIYEKPCPKIRHEKHNPYPKIRHGEKVQILENLNEKLKKQEIQIVGMNLALKNIININHNIELLRNSNYSNINNIYNYNLNRNIELLRNSNYSKLIIKSAPTETLELSKKITEIFGIHLKKINPKIQVKKFSKKNIDNLNKIMYDMLHGLNKMDYAPMFACAHDHKHIPLSKLENGFETHSDFLEVFKKSILIYEPEYRPLNKSILPKNPVDFFYNPYRKLVSYFYFYGFGEIKKINNKQTDLLNAEQLEFMDFIAAYYFKRDLESLEKDFISKFIIYFSNEFDSICNQSIIIDSVKLYRKDFETDLFKIYFQDKKVLLKNFLDYLSNRKMQPSSFQFSIENWSKFATYYFRCFHIQFYPKKIDLFSIYKNFKKN